MGTFDGRAQPSRCRNGPPYRAVRFNGLTQSLSHSFTEFASSSRGKWLRNGDKASLKLWWHELDWGEKKPGQGQPFHASLIGITLI